MFKPTVVALALFGAAMSAQALSLPPNFMTITGFQVNLTDSQGSSFGIISDTDFGSAINSPTDLIANISPDAFSFLFLGLTGYAGTTALATGNLTRTGAGSAEISFDLSSWNVFWNGMDIPQGGVATGTATRIAGGGWDYTASWNSAITDGAFAGITGNWEISGQLRRPAPLPVLRSSVSAPVPEADTYAMMLAGLVLTGLMTRWRKPA
jgi:hypothetical protein